MSWFEKLVPSTIIKKEPDSKKHLSRRFMEQML